MPSTMLPNGEPRRTKETCDMCSSSKTRCDKVRPICGRCQRLNYPCFYSPALRIRKRKATEAASPQGPNKSRCLPSQPSEHGPTRRVRATSQGPSGNQVNAHNAVSEVLLSNAENSDADNTQYFGIDPALISMSAFMNHGLHGYPEQLGPIANPDDLLAMEMSHLPLPDDLFNDIDFDLDASLSSFLQDPQLFGQSPPEIQQLPVLEAAPAPFHPAQPSGLNLAEIQQPSLFAAAPAMLPQTRLAEPRPANVQQQLYFAAPSAELQQPQLLEDVPAEDQQPQLIQAIPSEIQHAQPLDATTADSQEPRLVPAAPAVVRPRSLGMASAGIPLHNAVLTARGCAAEAVELLRHLITQSQESLRLRRGETPRSSGGVFSGRTGRRHPHPVASAVKCFSRALVCPCSRRVHVDMLVATGCVALLEGTEESLREATSRPTAPYASHLRLVAQGLPVNRPLLRVLSDLRCVSILITQFSQSHQQGPSARSLVVVMHRLGFGMTGRLRNVIEVATSAAAQI